MLIFSFSALSNDTIGQFFMIFLPFWRVAYGFFSIFAQKLKRITI
jgi:hypothetical protein